MFAHRTLVDRNIVVSGPIGSGKSTVGRLLAGKGAHLIDADRVGHVVLEPDGEAFAEVAAGWPDVVVDGRIDRSRLAGIVFADESELAKLEAITHPHIARRIHAAADNVPDDVADAVAARVIVVELPLTIDLLGDGWHRLVVLAPDDVRLLRAVARGMTEPDVRRRMASQATHSVWESIADSVIVNDGDLETLADNVDAWWGAVVGQ